MDEAHRSLMAERGVGSLLPVGAISVCRPDGSSRVKSPATSNERACPLAVAHLLRHCASSEWHPAGDVGYSAATGAPPQAAAARRPEQPQNITLGVFLEI